MKTRYRFEGHFFREINFTEIFRENDFFFYHLQDAIQETPEDGIIDDENVPGDEEMKDENDQGDEQNPPEESSEDAIKDETNPEEVLASG